jgi:hypothetical protein
MEAKTIINKKGILSKMSNARGITIPGFKIYCHESMHVEHKTEDP